MKVTVEVTVEHGTLDESPEIRVIVEKGWNKIGSTGAHPIQSAADEAARRAIAAYNG